MTSSTPTAKLAGLKRHSEEQHQNSLNLIRAAAEALFVRDGYLAVSMEDVAQAAGVTRKTLYRHFGSKFDLAVDLTDRRWPATLPFWTEIRDRRFLELDEVRGWIRGLLDHYRGRTDMQLIVELASTEPRYTRRRTRSVDEMICELGRGIPVFAEAAAAPDGETRARAYLLIVMMMEECAVTALGASRIAEPTLVNVLADWFHGFVARGRH
jgi:AcrR family transcriptional regulator